MTKEERYAIWNRYYQRHKTEINSRRKIVRENYKNKLSKAENKIVELEGQVTRAFEVLEGKRKQIEELEQKLEQTEKDLTDYQFNYPKIKDLEKENTTLKKQLEALSGDIPWNKLKDVSEVTKKLTEAKDLLSRWTDDRPYTVSEQKDLIADTEQFLKE